MKYLKEIASVGAAASTMMYILASKSGSVGDMFSVHDSNASLDAYNNSISGFGDLHNTQIANIAEEEIMGSREYSGGLKEFLKMAYDVFRHPFEDSTKDNSKKQNNTTNQSNNKTDNPEAYIKSLGLKSYESQTNQTEMQKESSIMPVVTQEKKEVVDTVEEKYDFRKDTRLKDAKPKTLYVFATPRIFEEHGGTKTSIENDLKILPEYMNHYLARFDVGVAIDNVVFAGVADFKEDDADKIIKNELNTKYGCKYLRENDIPSQNALFLGLVDDSTWKKNLGDEYSEDYGWGYEDGGGIIRFPSGTSFSVIDRIAVHEVIGHGWGLLDRRDVPHDIMDNSAAFSEGSPDTFVDGWKIKLNADKKVNIC